jgi:hypothetical protein
MGPAPTYSISRCPSDRCVGAILQLHSSTYPESRSNTNLYGLRLPEKIDLREIDDFVASTA